MPRKNVTPKLAFLLFQLVCKGLFAQDYFEVDKLPFPKKYGPEIKQKFKEEFVYEFKVDSGKHAIFLKNGLRSSQFVAPQIWLKAKDTTYPYRIDIVYSRYPVHNNVYHEIYPLLCNRLIHLFKLDPTLNNPDFEWRTILQTHIDNDDQVNTLFHGVVIWYRTQAEEDRENESQAQLSKDKKTNELGAQDGINETEAALSQLKESSLISDSLKTIIANKPLDLQRQMVKQELTKEIQPSTIKLTERTPLEMQQFKRQVVEFLKYNPYSDSVVWKVLNRHPEWADALVINDWTGSMYGYGAQVLHWHLMNYQTSGIRYLTLFNDGDNKPNASKVIGETGGIYSAEASDIPTIMNLFNLVRLNGCGGDRQENDIEAILEAMKRYPNHKEIILIADNLACIRDIELAGKINRPVRVIVCGYNKLIGINPHLAYLAKLTNGGLYTLNQDLEDLKLETIGLGEIGGFKDRRFTISPMDCKPRPIYEIKYAKESFKTYTQYDSAYIEKDEVRQLDLREQEIKKIPSGIFKMKKMLNLNLSKNEIKQIPTGIKKLENLKEMDLSHNQIQVLPKSFEKLKYLEGLNLSHNQFVTLKDYYPSGYYLKKLYASNNQLKEIEGINQLKNLQYLNLSNNNINELPAEIHQLKKLISIDLSNNQLLYLPRTFGGLTKLEELNLENNQIGSLPPYLYRLRKLKSLNLAGNPLGEKEKERLRKELPQVFITF